MVPPTGEPGGDPTVAADDFIARLREIHDLYDEADRSVREVTEFADEVMIPPVNELRYAGHHVLQAVAAKTDDRRTEHVQKAHRHCERALYDAAEIGIMEAVEIISEFRMAYPTLQIFGRHPRLPRHPGGGPRCTAEGHRRTLEARIRSSAGNRVHGNLLKLVWVESAPVRCLHSRGTASR